MWFVYINIMPNEDAGFPGAETVGCGHLRERLGIELKTFVRAKVILKRFWGSKSGLWVCVASFYPLSYLIGLVFPKQYSFSLFL